MNKQAKCTSDKGGVAQQELREHEARLPFMASCAALDNVLGHMQADQPTPCCTQLLLLAAQTLQQMAIIHSCWCVAIRLLAPAVCVYSMLLRQQAVLHVTSSRPG